MGLNPRIYAFGALVGIMVLITFGGGFLFPKAPVEEEKIQRIVIEKNVEVLVTPTPDGHLYFASEYQNGTRLLQRPYSWIRNDALYKADMKVTIIVYDYKFFDKMHWFNPAEYKYHEVAPADSNKKYCLIFVYVFMDDVAGDDTRMWALNRSAFAVYDGKETYRPVTYPYQLRFRELENTPTFDKATNVQAYKSLRLYSPSTTFVDTAGEYNEEQYYLRGGASNALDGYLIFEVDKNIDIEKTLVLGRFYAFGYSQWKLVA